MIYITFTIVFNDLYMIHSMTSQMFFIPVKLFDFTSLCTNSTSNIEYNLYKRDFVGVGGGGEIKGWGGGAVSISKISVMLAASSMLCAHDEYLPRRQIVRPRPVKACIECGNLHSHNNSFCSPKCCKDNSEVVL